MYTKFYLLDTNLSKIRIDESCPNLRLESFQNFQSYSRHYLSQFISSIPILSLWNRSIRATKYEKTTGTNETKTILWPAMNRYRKQRWISFDNDRIWIVRRASFIRDMGHSCFAIISRKIDGLSPSHTVMMEWRARTRARTLVASHLTIVELHLREQVNA